MAGYIFAAWTIIFLAGLFVFSLVNLPEFGFASLFWMALSGYSLVKVFRAMNKVYKKGVAPHAKVNRPKAQGTLPDGNTDQADR